MAYRNSFLEDRVRLGNYRLWLLCELADWECDMVIVNDSPELAVMRDLVLDKFVAEVDICRFRLTGHGRHYLESQLGKE